ncbi:MAG: hypothetical protein OEY87_07350, partial [Gammaproteobacteria bacterium]|nr:hypothetical protein [Gammaproteobacteria bacterium]
MLNYIWAGLIIISISFALGHDLHDEWNNTHENGLAIQIPFTQLDDSTLIELHYANTTISAHWKNSQHLQLIIPATSTSHKNKTFTHRLLSHDKELLADVTHIDPDNQSLTIVLPEIHWSRMQAISDAAFDMAKFAVTLAIALAGIMALWLGLMRIAEKSGMIFFFVKAIQPLLHWLFPEIPKNHPA